MHGSPEYISWMGMLARCRSETRKDTKHYKQRGITFHEPWSSFEQFYSDMGPRPEGRTLDRIDNDRGYFPDNCRWATLSEQNRNKRSNRILEHNGHSLPMIEWSEISGVPYKTLFMRLSRGWSVDRALTTPVSSRL